MRFATRRLLGQHGQVEIRANGAPLGAEVHGRDANEPLSAELVLRLKQALRDPHLFSQDRCRYTHRWGVGEIVYWDNQATLHARSAFEPGSRRVMKRISLGGGRPFRGFV